MSKPSSMKRNIVFSNGDETYARQHEPRVDIVPNLLTHGLVILSARPKAGKSELAHSIAMSIVIGDSPLGAGSAGDPGDVLYLDYENGDEINQARQHVMFPGGNKPSLARLTYAYQAPRFDEGLFEIIEEWRAQSANPRMVVVDVYGKAKPPRKRGLLAPEDDNRILEPLHQWANEHRVCVMLLTHNRRGPENPDDILGSVLGSSAMTGTPDICMILIRHRSTGETTLHATGRKLAGDQHVALARDRNWYTILGEAQQAAESAQRRAIKTVLSDHGRLAVREIADLTDMKPRNVSKLLHHMVKSKEVVRFGEGRFTAYQLPEGGSVQKRIIGNAKEETAENANDFNASVDQPIVTAIVTDEPAEPVTGNDAIVTVTAQTEPVTLPVTIENHVETNTCPSSVTASTKITQTDVAMKFLRFLANHPEGINHTKTLQNLRNNLDASQVKEAKAVLIPEGLMIETDDGYRITEAGSLKVNPQASLF
ncbi:hypothetical protein ATER59S_02456 [Aquamicrobium terrae]